MFNNKINTTKPLVLKVEDWARFFVKAYEFKYVKTSIGVVKLRQNDVYTKYNIKTSKKLDEILLKLCPHPEIGYEELVIKANEENVEFVYLDIELEKYILSFVVYDVSKNEITCLCDDEEELILAMKVFEEINSLCSK